MKIISLVLLLLSYSATVLAKPENDVLRFIPGFYDNAYFSHNMINADDTVSITLTDAQKQYSEQWHAGLKKTLEKPYDFFGGYYTYFITPKNPQDGCVEDNYCIWVVDYLHGRVIDKVPSAFHQIDSKSIINNPWSRVLQINDVLPSGQMRVYYYIVEDNDIGYYFDYFDNGEVDKKTKGKFIQNLEYIKSTGETCSMSIHDFDNWLDINTSRCDKPKSDKLITIPLGSTQDDKWMFVLMENILNRFSYHLYIEDQNGKYKNLLNTVSENNYILDATSNDLNFIQAPNKIFLNLEYDKEGLTIGDEHYSMSQLPLTIKLAGDNYTVIP